MKITRIYYSELQSKSDYSNRKIGVEVEVLPGESPEFRLQEARAWVQSQLGTEPVPDATVINKEVAKRLRDFASSLECPF